MRTASRTLLLFSALLVGCLAWGGAAEAASYGNTAANEALAAAVSTPLPGAANSTYGLLQTFEPSATWRPTNLRLYIAKHGSPTDALRIRLCAYPDVNAETPCDGKIVLLTDYATSTDLVADTGGQDTWAVDYAVDDGTTLYPGIEYGIEITRTTGTGTTNNYRVGYTVADYADGEARYRVGSACSSPHWTYLTSTGADCGNTTGSTYDLRFALTAFGGDIDLVATAAGSAIYARGTCVEFDEVPAGWILSQTVELLYEDISATGTSMFETVDCTDGTFTNAPSFRPAWDGQWRVTARQSGVPSSVEDVETLALYGSVTPNPRDLLGISDCAGYSLATDLNNAAGCYINNFIHNVLRFPPFLWYDQIRLAVLSSTSTSLDATLRVPALGAQASREIELFVTGATSTGIIGELNAVGDVGGNSWSEWLELIAWLGFLAYAVARMNEIFSDI